MNTSSSGQGKLGMTQPETARKNVKDLKPGQTVSGVRFSVRSKRLQEFRNKPGQYLALKLGDSTGEITARMWDNAEEAATGFEQGDVVAVSGRVEAYQDQAQLVLTSIVKCPAEQVKAEEFLPRSARDPDEMMATLLRACQSVKHTGLRKLLLSVFQDEQFAAAFMTCPGAKGVHHAYIGGLIEHTLNVATICDNICEIYPRLNRDMLIAGALLHDIGKVREYAYDCTIEITDEGGLVGHIVVGYHMVMARMEQIAELTAEERLRIAHLVVAHHGAAEFGAPRVPMTAEAIALHYGENLDAQVNAYFAAVDTDKGQRKGWTDWISRLDRYLFLGTDEAADVE